MKTELLKKHCAYLRQSGKGKSKVADAIEELIEQTKPKKYIVYPCSGHDKETELEEMRLAVKTGRIPRKIKRMNE